MKALVTGGAGFIGFNLCLRLEQLKWDVVVIDDYSSGHRSNRVPAFMYQDMSILDPAAQELFRHKFDVVFHLAAIPRVTYSVEYPLDTTNANVVGTINLLEGVRKYSPSTKFVYSSSSSVYGGADVLPTQESHPLDPKSPYALQKSQSEQWCELYSSLYGLNTVCLRYFNCFGPYSRYGGPYTTVLGAWMYSQYVDVSVKPYLEGDGSQSRDFCFVSNVVDANIATVMSNKQFKGEPFNIAHGERHDLLMCKQLLEDIHGEPLDLELRPPRVGDVDHTLADISAAKEAFGYDPTVNFEQQVQTMVEWYKTSYAAEVASQQLQS